MDERSKLMEFLEVDMGYDKLLCLPEKYDAAFIGVDIIRNDTVAYSLSKLIEIDPDWEKDYLLLKSDDRCLPWIVDTVSDWTGLKSLSNLDDYIYGSCDNRLVYLYGRLVEGFMKTQGMTDEEAVEWVDYNTLRSIPYEGITGPIVLMEYPEFFED